MTDIAAALSEEIETWRDELIHHLALKITKLPFRELDVAAQRIIESLLLLRFLENRGFEPRDRLQSTLDCPNLYSRLQAMFRRCGKRYHSDLFTFGLQREPGQSIGGPPIDDEPLRRIVARLCDPKNSASLAALSVDFLGPMHEDFLGRSGRLTKGGKTPAKRKSGLRKGSGVYYTPAAIVEYVVNNTVGMLLAQTSRHEASCLRILDPACGSGYFLIAAYRYLLDWHRDWYVADGAERHARGAAPPLYRGVDGQWRLAAMHRERILMDSIFGVDIDPHAVEITKLSLVLQLHENQSDDPDAKQACPRLPRPLPNLAGNIKCGDAIVGSDFSDSERTDRSPMSDHPRGRQFDWWNEFRQIAECGGFDAVIGNPPWGQKSLLLDEDGKRFLREKYQSLSGIFDLFRPFVERGIRLVRPGGFCGMVLPDIVLLKDYPDTRRFMLDHLALTDVRWWGMAFEDAVIDAVTVLGRREAVAEEHRIRVRVDDPAEPLEHRIPQADFLGNPRYVFNLHLTREKRTVLKSLESLPRIGDFFEVHEGVHSGNMRSELFVDSRRDDSCRPMYFGRDEIARYRLQWQGRYLRLAAAPKTRTTGKYANLGHAAWHERPKVLVRRTGDHVLAAVDEKGYYASNNFFILFSKGACSLDLHGLASLLNSPLMTWYFRTIEPRKGRAFSELKIKHIRTFPLPPAVEQPGGCRELNCLGAQRASEAGDRAPQQLDAALQERIASMYPCASIRVQE
ncbi:MAG: N-6 DNA methylase [Rhodopirellula sp.]|nr:N-6 DNA methylase [Rhodopirellula sp.]